MNCNHDDSAVWSAKSRSAMSNIPDFQMFPIAIRRIVLSEIASGCAANFWPTSIWVKRASSVVGGFHWTIIRLRFALMSGSSSRAYVLQKWTTN